MWVALLSTDTPHGGGCILYSQAKRVYFFTPSGNCFYTHFYVTGFWPKVRFAKPIMAPPGNGVTDRHTLAYMEFTRGRLFVG